VKRRSLLALGLALPFAPAIRSAAAQSSQRPLEWYRGKILFKSDRTGQEALYAVNSDGSGLTRLDDVNAGYHYAEALTRDAISSDGSYKLFVRDILRVSRPPIWDAEIWQEDSATGQTSLITAGPPALNTGDSAYRPSFNYEPVWAPDNRYIAYVSQVDGNDEIYLYDRVRLSNTRLTNNAWEWDKHPSFSPDGTQIVFWSNRVVRFKHIWVMNADGTGVRNLTGYGSYNDWDPVWVKQTPSGIIPEAEPLDLDVELRVEPGCSPALADYVGKIIFKSDSEGAPAIYLLDPDTGDACRVDDPNVGFYYAEALRRDALSPDGRYRLFVRQEGSEDYQIWQEDTQTAAVGYVGGGGPGADYEPAWSPDGNLVAYVSQRDGNDEIYLYDRNDKTDRRLTRNNWEWDKHPSFSPDGASLVYWTNEGSGWKQLRIMNVDGSGVRGTGRGGDWNDWDPVWVKEVPSPAPEIDTGLLPLATLEPKEPVKLEPLPLEWYLNKVLFISDRDGSEAIYAVNPDGTDLTRVDDPNAAFYYAEGRARDITTPDGRYLLFVREVGDDLQVWQQDTENGAISYVVGGGPGIDYEAVWGPDTRYVAYVSQRDGNDEIHLYDRISQTDRRLTDNSWETDKHPTFRADGTEIAFWSDRESHYQHIWVMGADGASPRNISGWESANDWNPVWIKRLPSVPQ